MLAIGSASGVPRDGVGSVEDTVCGLDITASNNRIMRCCHCKRGVNFHELRLVNPVSCLRRAVLQSAPNGSICTAIYDALHQPRALRRAGVQWYTAAVCDKRRN
jgi:hypothetical protein